MIAYATTNDLASIRVVESPSNCIFVSLKMKVDMKDEGRNSKKAFSALSLTPSVLVKATSRAIQQASKRAMDTSGYVVVAEGDWVVRIHKDGHKERISRIEPIKRPQSVKLD